jgi:hypothetical protein
MRKFQTDPEYRNNLARQGRQGFLENWSEAAIIPQFLDVIRRTALKTQRNDIVETLEALKQ